MRSLEQLIEEQVRRWSLERRAKKKAEEASAQTPWPVISISRQFGSRGSAIGQAVAEKTGFTFWDSELLHQMADEANASRTTLAWVDEHPRGAWADFLDGMLLGDEYTESEYLRRLIRVLDGIQKTGASVVVGRGTQFILKPGYALRVRFVCPMEQRIKGVMKRHDQTKKEALKLIAKVDKEREIFMQHHYGRALEDASNFDIVLNSGTMSKDVAVATVMTAYESRFRRSPTRD
jgi:cytidylate kinase